MKIDPSFELNSDLDFQAEKNVASSSPTQRRLSVLGVN
jgi:hypothetical protein